MATEHGHRKANSDSAPDRAPMGALAKRGRNGAGQRACARRPGNV